MSNFNLVTDISAQFNTVSQLPMNLTANMYNSDSVKQINASNQILNALEYIALQSVVLSTPIGTNRLIDNHTPTQEMVSTKFYLRI